jgi:hypothetical protein
MNDINIFDLEDVSDLPASIVKRTVNHGVSGRPYTGIIMGLFAIKSTLSINEIIVALYRAHKMDKSRTWVGNILYRMKKKGLVKKVGYGSYECIKKS